MNNNNYLEFINDNVNDYCSKYNLNGISKGYYSEEDNIKTVYAIGDIHGDKDALFYILYKLNIIDKNYRWNKNIKNTVIIQTGDIMDGYRPDIENKYTKKSKWRYNSFDTIDLILDLNKEANKCNSYINLILGNHEISNIHIYDNYKTNNDTEYIKNQLVYSIPRNSSNNDIKEYMNRLEEYIKYFICYYKSFVIVNNYIFCHAGLVKKYIDYIIKNFINLELFLEQTEEEKNNIINSILSGLIFFITNKESLNKLDYKNYGFELNDINEKLNRSQKYIYKFYGNRKYVDITRDKTDNKYIVNYNKKYYNIKKEYDNIKIYFDNAFGMIVGHSVTINQTIYKYDVYDNNSLIYLDTAISQAFHRITNSEKNRYYYVLKISFKKKYETPIIEIIKIKKYTYTY